MAVDPRRLSVVLAAVAGVAALALLWPTIPPTPSGGAGTPDLNPATAAGRRGPRGQQPTHGEGPRQARVVAADAASTAPTSVDVEDAADNRRGQASTSPATITADDPADAELLTDAAATAGAWAVAFATTDADETSWLQRLRPHTTPRFLTVLAEAGRADLLGDRPRRARALATEIVGATAERVAVGVRLAFDGDDGEHVLEVVVVPTPAGPRVDEVRL